MFRGIALGHDFTRYGETGRHDLWRGVITIAGLTSNRIAECHDTPDIVSADGQFTRYPPYTSFARLAILDRKVD